MATNMLTLALGIGFLLAVPAAQAQIAYGNDDSFASSAIRGLGDRAQMQAMPVASSGSWASASASAGGAPSFDIAARQMQQVNPAGGLFGGGGGLFNAGGLLNGVTSGIGSMGATASALASGGRAAAPGGSIFNLGGMGNGISQLIQMPGRVVVGAASGAAAATGGAGGTGLINSLVNSFLVRSPARVGAGGASASALPLLQIANPLTAQLFPVRQAPRRSECVVFTVRRARGGAGRHGAGPTVRWAAGPWGCGADWLLAVCVADRVTTAGPRVSGVIHLMSRGEVLGASVVDSPPRRARSHSRTPRLVPTRTPLPSSAQPGFSESLEQVSGRLGIPTAQLLADNVASVSAASEPLLGRNILVCGLQQARPVAAPPAPTRAPAPPGVPAPAPAAPPTLMPAPAPAPAPVTPGKQLLAPKQKQEAGERPRGTLAHACSAAGAVLARHGPAAFSSARRPQAAARATCASPHHPPPPSAGACTPPPSHRALAQRRATPTLTQP